MDEIKKLTLKDFLWGLLILVICLFIAASEHIVLWLNYPVQ